MFLRSYLGGSGLSPRRTGSIVGVRNTSTRLTRLRSASFKDFMAHQGHANLSQEELEKLYVQFLEWNRRAKN